MCLRARRGKLQNSLNCYHCGTRQLSIMVASPSKTGKQKKTLQANTQKCRRQHKFALMLFSACLPDNNKYKPAKGAVLLALSKYGGLASALGLAHPRHTRTPTRVCSPEEQTILKSKLAGKDFRSGRADTSPDALTIVPLTCAFCTQWQDGVAF